MTAELFELKSVRRSRAEADANLSLVTSAAKQRYVAQVLAGADPGLTAMAQRVAERIDPPALEDIAVIDDSASIETVRVIEPQRYWK